MHMLSSLSDFFFPQKIKDVGILRPINHILRTQNKSLTERCLSSKAPFKRLLFPSFPANQFALLVPWWGGGCGSFPVGKKIGSFPAWGVKWFTQDYGHGEMLGKSEMGHLWTSLPEYIRNLPKNSRNITEKVSNFSSGTLKSSCRSDIQELCCWGTDHSKGKMGKREEKNACCSICHSELLWGFLNTHQVRQNVTNQGTWLSTAVSNGKF